MHLLAVLALSRAAARKAILECDDEDACACSRNIPHKSLQYTIQPNNMPQNSNPVDSTEEQPICPPIYNARADHIPHIYPAIYPTSVVDIPHKSSLAIYQTRRTHPCTTQVPTIYQTSLEQQFTKQGPVLCLVLLIIMLCTPLL